MIRRGGGVLAALALLAAPLAGQASIGSGVDYQGYYFDRSLGSDAASLLMVTCYPAELHPALPEPRSPRLGPWLDRWAEHPGTAWVREMYRRHRGSSAELPHR